MSPNEERILLERVSLLEQRVAALESRPYDGDASADPPQKEAKSEAMITAAGAARDRERLSHILRSLRQLGGSATLDQIASANNHLSKAGVRAQLVRLCLNHDVYQPKRGEYALKEVLK
jgi:hypothetical protein